jgi:hypothetical protein
MVWKLKVQDCAAAFFQPLVRALDGITSEAGKRGRDHMMREKAREQRVPVLLFYNPSCRNKLGSHKNCINCLRG